MTRAGQQLTPQAQADRDSFEAGFKDRGCTCFRNPPCGYCTDPGNPRNQEEHDACWEPEGLRDTIEALNTLNSWVRSSSGKRHGVTKAIYFFKNTAIKHAYQAGMIEATRKVKVLVKCRDCSGSGRYEDWSGHKFDHCRACSSTGTAELRFIESTICGHHWHTPWLKWPIASIRPDSAEPWHATDWKPNQPGRDMPLDDAVRLINQVEEYFTERPTRWSGEFGLCDDYNYRLDLGRVPALCQFCGDDDVREHGYHCSRGLIEWSAKVCHHCKAALGDTAVFDLMPVPLNLITPEIRRWILRHARECPGKDDRVQNLLSTLKPLTTLNHH